MADAPTNYFTGAEVAARYAKARPFFHDEAVEWICRAAGRRRFARALDVGCGSGLSTVALAAIADDVVGVDCAQGMLDEAAPRENVRYLCGRAEEMEFAAGEFELVTVGSALHWFEQERFLKECGRVLAAEGALAVYNDHFTTHMQESAECKRWMRTRFAKRFPAPRRGMRDIDERKAEACGFEIRERGWFNHLAEFSREEFIAYLLTRSNTLAAIDSGRETEESIAKWLDGELAAIVADGARGRFLFKCNLWLLRKGGKP